MYPALIPSFSGKGVAEYPAVTSLILAHGIASRRCSICPPASAQILGAGRPETTDGSAPEPNHYGDYRQVMRSSVDGRHGLARHRDLLFVLAIIAGGWFLGTVRLPVGPDAVSGVGVGGARPPAAPPESSTAADDLPRYGPHTGNLPNGSTYRIFLSVDRTAAVQGVSAGIVIDRPGEAATILGIVSFDDGRPGEGLTDDGVYWRRSGNWSMRITPDYDFVTTYAGAAEAWLDEHIIVSEGIGGLPAFDLVEPLRWAADDELPLQMQVIYDSFVVRRGCSDLAIACSDTPTMEVLSLHDVVTPAAHLDASASITSANSRPVSDPSDLDRKRPRLRTWTPG